jgi:hypothetical protein
MVCGDSGPCGGGAGGANGGGANGGLPPGGNGCDGCGSDPQGGAPLTCGSWQHLNGAGTGCVSDTITINAPDGTSKTVDADAQALFPGHKLTAATLASLRSSSEGYDGSSSVTFGDLLNWAETSEAGWDMLCQLMGFTPRDTQADMFDHNPNIYDNPSDHAKFWGAVLGIAVAVPLAVGATGACLAGAGACVPLVASSIGANAATALLNGAAPSKVAADTTINLVLLGAGQLGESINAVRAEGQAAVKGWDAVAEQVEEGEEGAPTFGQYATYRLISTSPELGLQGIDVNEIFATDSDGKYDPHFSTMQVVG